MSFLSGVFKRLSRRDKAARAPEAPPKKVKAELRGAFVRHEQGLDKVVWKDLRLHGVDGAILVDFGDLTLLPGDRMMISGPAGCGKSAALAAMRNAWLLGGEGNIVLPPEIRFVPQEDYFPDRSLRGIICSPDPVSRYTREEVVKAMTDAGLEDFIAEMDDVTKRGEYWRNTLSGGQKNKLGFAGVFLHAPEIKVLIVDEITAALDAKSEADLYPKLLDRMRHGIVISVAHHDTIVPLHNIVAVVADGKVTYASGVKADKPNQPQPPVPPKP